MDYLTKLDQPSQVSKELIWNIPEQKLGSVNIIGGNSQSFRTPVKTAEFLSQNYPIKTINLVLPDALKASLPPLPGLIFLSSTDSGSFGNKDELISTTSSADFSLLIGDVSKNSITRKAIASACEAADKPLLITRDAVDAVAGCLSESTLMNENLIFLATLPQLIQIFRAVYYPKMLLLSQPFIQIAEALHKFTLSYPAQIITLHDGQVLIAKNGLVFAVPLSASNYSPLNLWSGEYAAKLLALNLFNPGSFEKSATAALA